MSLIKNLSVAALVVFSSLAFADDGGLPLDNPKGAQSQEEDWISLFDGKTLDGWKVNENPGTFSVEDGAIKVHGPRAHLFYDGDVKDHEFKNFELKVDVMTFPGANSGIYFHTKFQDEGFPGIGHEVQVNVSHTDWRRSGSLYGVVNIDHVPVKDNQWYTQHIIVKGNNVRIFLDGILMFEYNQPKLAVEPGKGQSISSGTFALQGHDPESKVLFRNIKVRVLPD